jgi:chaperonin cofactor prefoldin
MLYNEQIRMRDNQYEIKSLQIQIDQFKDTKDRLENRIETYQSQRDEFRERYINDSNAVKEMQLELK